MCIRMPLVSLAATVLTLLAGSDRQGEWKPHDPRRPQPAQVLPVRAGAAPSDAVVLFNGRDLSEWTDHRGHPPRWRVSDGYFEVLPGAGSIQTRRAFGNCQIHLEWQAPDPPQGTGQKRANSGVKIMGLYEIQVLDSFNNPTYADGVAGAVYSEHPPLVNAGLPPGEWQTLDIIFHTPRFGPDGAQTRPAVVTVLYNGVLVQDNAVISGPTGFMDDGRRLPNKPHPDRLPLLLQEHECTVRYRNVWVRELSWLR